MEKTNYNFGAMRKGEHSSIGYIEGWTFEPKNRPLLSSREVNVNGTNKKVVTLTISSTLAKSAMKYNFGDEFEKEQHFIECTAWGPIAERLEKFAPTPRMILGLFGELKVQEYDKNDGSGKGKKLVMTIDNFKAVTKKQAGATDSNAGETFNEVATGDMPF